MSLTFGARLGPYEISAPIGAGGMGEVFRARDTRLNRDVAIKVLPAAFADDPERVARFNREAQTLASLNHPNIATIHGIEDVPPVNGSTGPGSRALVMELVEGEDLSAHIARGPIPVAEALPIARQIAEALAAAHEQGIVHRDLKPANIKVREDGTVKVLDFGLAKAMDSAGVSSSNPNVSHSPTLTHQGTSAGMIVGTAAYMSPEQARGKAVDKRADIWAFGVVFYEMLTGRRLFTGETVSDVLAAVLVKEPDLSRIPESCRGLIAHCLDRDPRKRLRDLGDVWLLLDENAPARVSRAPMAGAMWAWLLATAVVTALATAAVVATRGGAASASPIVFSELPPPGNRFVNAPFPSPDGRRLAMVAVDGAGVTRLWTRDLGDATARAVAGTEGIDASTFPFWSPDSQQVAFLAQGQVRRVALSGGLPAVVVAASPKSGVWLNDGDMLLAIGGKGLMRVSATGGALRDVRGFTSDDFRNLQIDGLDVSPDGRTLLFTQFGGETGVYVASVDGGEKRLLVPGEQNVAVFAGPDHIVRADATGLVAQRFDAKGQTLVGDAFPVAQSGGASAFSGSTGGALSFMTGAETLSRMTSFTREGKADGVLGPDAVYQEVAISRDGKLLAFARTDPADGNVDIWVQAPTGGAPRRLTSDADIDHRPVLSHDGCCIAWESHAKGLLNLMERPVDGSSPARLIRTWGKAGGPSDWSADGRFVLYQSSDGSSGSNLWAVPRETQSEPTRLTQPGFGADDGQFSPDGRYLAFTGQETGETEVYVQRVEGMKLVGGPMRVSESGGNSPQWGRGGSELYFVNRGTIFSVPFQGTADRPAGEPRALFTVPSFGGARPEFRNFAPMPDGRRFVALVSVVDPTPHPATVILNWRANLGGKP